MVFASVQKDGYRWVMLTLFVLMSLFIWSAWFAQAPLLETYWAKVFHIGAATGNLLLSLPGLVAIFLGVATGRWVDTIGTKKLLGIGAICALIGFGLRPLFMTSFATQAVLTTIAGYGIACLTACLGPLMIQWFGHENAHTYIGIGAWLIFHRRRPGHHRHCRPVGSAGHLWCLLALQHPHPGHYRPVVDPGPSTGDRPSSGKAFVCQ